MGGEQVTPEQGDEVGRALPTNWTHTHTMQRVQDARTGRPKTVCGLVVCNDEPLPTNLGLPPCRKCAARLQGNPDWRTA